MKIFMIAVFVGLLPAVAEAQLTDEYRRIYAVRRTALEQCRQEHGIATALPPEEPAADHLLPLQALDLPEECEDPDARPAESVRVARTAESRVSVQPAPVRVELALPAPTKNASPERETPRVEHPAQPAVQPEPAHPTPAPSPAQAQGLETAPMEVAEPIHMLPPELVGEVQRTLHRVLDADVPDASVTALARSLLPMEETERDAVLECIEDQGGRVRSERESDRRLRRMRTAVANCVSPPEPEATPEQLAEIVEGTMYGANALPQNYSAALDGVGFVGDIPDNWRYAGDRALTIQNVASRDGRFYCYLEVKVGGERIQMMRKRSAVPVEARIDGRADYVPVIPPGEEAHLVFGDSDPRTVEFICHERSVDEDGTPDRIMDRGQVIELAAAGPVHPTWRGSYNVTADNVPRRSGFRVFQVRAEELPYRY